MAHGFIRSFNERIIVRSAGTEPGDRINPLAVKAMKEVGIDIGRHTPHLVDQYLKEEWDYVITVCDDANEKCPVFIGKVKTRLHTGFEDPSKAIGSGKFIWSEFKRVRDEIRDAFYQLYVEEMEGDLGI
jgi:arsenate reductase